MTMPGGGGGGATLEHMSIYLIYTYILKSSGVSMPVSVQGMHAARGPAHFQDQRQTRPYASTFTRSLLAFAVTKAWGVEVGVKHGRRCVFSFFFFF